ncbi:MAG TPA: hypothetical protein G4O01_06810 [Dehalococcoidia bacterium]|jgi:uncharacterized membrane protein YphA (DoxX/SURF4 family)|nr:hypothetical protein [Dehalococcoidia bacterium]
MTRRSADAIINVAGKLIWPFLRPYFTLFSRAALGGILLFAGIVKLPHVDTLLWEVVQYDLLPYGPVSIYSHALPPVEIALGSFLILGVLLKLSASLSGLLVLSFAIAKISALVRGLDIEVCPCFGPAVPLLAVHSLAIDLVMLALALQIVIFGSRFFSIDALFLGKTSLYR